VREAACTQQRLKAKNDATDRRGLCGAASRRRAVRAVQQRPKRQCPRLALFHYNCRPYVLVTEDLAFSRCVQNSPPQISDRFRTAAAPTMHHSSAPVSRIDLSRAAAQKRMPGQWPLPHAYTLNVNTFLSRDGCEILLDPAMNGHPSQYDDIELQHRYGARRHHSRACGRLVLQVQQAASIASIALELDDLRRRTNMSFRARRTAQTAHTCRPRRARASRGIRKNWWCATAGDPRSIKSGDARGVRRRLRADLGRYSRKTTETVAC
jgi:hypothetical protein